MNIRDWLVNVLRDPVWQGIAGVVALLGLLFALFRFAVNLVRSIRTQQSLMQAANKTVQEMVGWLKRLFDYIFTRSWKVHVLISIVIYAAFWGPRSAVPELASLRAFLAAVCWLLIRAVYVLQKEAQSLHERLRLYGLETLSLPDNVTTVYDMTRRYPNLSLGEKWFNGVPFLLSANYFETSAIGLRQAEIKLDRPLRHISSVHLLVNAGNGWKRHMGKNLEGVTIGRIRLLFNDGTSQETRLILGHNVREWAPGNKPGELVDQVTDPLSRIAWKGKNAAGNEAVIDHLKIPIQEIHTHKSLERISILRDIEPGTPEDTLALAIFAITLER